MTPLANQELEIEILDRLDRCGFVYRSD